MLKPIPELIAEVRANIRVLSAAEAKIEIAANNGVLIDVREPDEVAAKPAPNSINMPRGVVEMKMSSNFADSLKPVYIHCASGARACLAAEQLQRLGYANVSAIACAIDDICSV